MSADLFSLPYTSKTSGVKFKDLIGYIKRTVPEYDEVVSSRVLRSSHILGCMGNTVCVSTEESIKDLGLTGEAKLHTVFDFQDVVSRLEGTPGSEETIAHAMGNFDEIPAYESAILHMNDLINRLNYLQGNLQIITIGDVQTLNDTTFASLYKSYLTKVFEIYDIHQQLNTITNSLSFLSKYYAIDAEDINRVIDAVSLKVAEFQNILEYIRYDNAKLSTAIDPVRLANDYPELTILSRV
jgi:hypothetical protein